MHGKVALITGSSRGIGFGIAKAFAREGATVILTSRKIENLKSAAALLPGDHVCFPVHFGDTEAIDRLADFVGERYGRLDVLVNNFGWNPVHEPLADLSLDVFNKMLQYNLTNYWYTTKKLLPLIPQDSGSSIINISSHSGRKPFENFGAYCMVKSGIDMMTRVFAKELAQKRINVNAIAPGYVDTDFNRLRTDLPEKNKLKEIIPNGVIATPDDIAELAVLLASKGGRYINGEVIVIDGGFSSLA